MLPKMPSQLSTDSIVAVLVTNITRWAQLLLTSAERSWAGAMSMKSIQSPENTQKPMLGSTKRQIISRFRKAILYASNLVEILQDQSTTKATNQDVLEAKAYLALLRGGSDFERNRWASCISNYSFVRIVYTTLSSSTQTDVYRDLLEGTIDPSIKYAAYQEKLPRTKAVQDIAIENFPSTESQSREEILTVDSEAFETSTEKAAAQTEGAGDLPTTIEWRGRKVNIEDAAISQALGAAHVKEDALAQVFSSESESRSPRDLAAAYDDVINARQDAADATKTAIDELLAEGVEQGDPRIQALQITRTAVNYGVIEYRVGRNRVLCGEGDGLTFEPLKSKQSSKARKDGKERVTKDEPNGRKLARLRERMALYDSILQNLDAVKQLPGVIADTAFVKELEAKRNYFRALKCLAIGRSHAVNGHVNNALGLFSRAQQLGQNVAATPSPSSKVPKLDISGAQHEALGSHLAAITLRYRALADLQNSTTASQKALQSKQYAPPLLERLHLNQYDDNVDLKNIVNYPPKLQPIPMKPLFFDLAWDYIKYPGQAQEVQEKTAAPAPVPATTEQVEEAPKKRGWFGFGR